MWSVATRVVPRKHTGCDQDELARSTGGDHATALHVAIAAAVRSLASLYGPLSSLRLLPVLYTSPAISCMTRVGWISARDGSDWLSQLPAPTRESGPPTAAGCPPGGGGRPPGGGGRRTTPARPNGRCGNWPAGPLTGGIHLSNQLIESCVCGSVGEDGSARWTNKQQNTTV